MLGDALQSIGFTKGFFFTFVSQALFGIAVLVVAAIIFAIFGDWKGSM